METLEKKLGYTFQDRSLLENALTHSSCANESRGRLQSNERLEFLGDSILGMVVADHLYRNHPDLPEGDLTRTRAALVCEESRLIGKTALSSALCGRRPRFFFTFPGPSYIIVWLKSTRSPDFREFYKRE